MLGSLSPSEASQTQAVRHQVIRFQALAADGPVPTIFDFFIRESPVAPGLFARFYWAQPAVLQASDGALPLAPLPTG
ncbi:MAG: hypothetical protein JWM16_4716 [Verrucomicrobiales bacterium]|nr:hypothetical protein [Verrucomicrobiales bacterium]